jgi:hypothetical protein
MKRAIPRTTYWCKKMSNLLGINHQGLEKCLRDTDVTMWRCEKKYQIHLD